MGEPLSVSGTGKSSADNEAEGQQKPAPETNLVSVRRKNMSKSEPRLRSSKHNRQNCMNSLSKQSSPESRDSGNNSNGSSSSSKNSSTICRHTSMDDSTVLAAKMQTRTDVALTTRSLPAKLQNLVAVPKLAPLSPRIVARFPMANDPVIMHPMLLNPFGNAISPWISGNNCYIPAPPVPLVQIQQPTGITCKELGSCILEKSPPALARNTRDGRRGGHKSTGNTSKEEKQDVRGKSGKQRCHSPKDPEIPSKTEHKMWISIAHRSKPGKGERKKSKEEAHDDRKLGGYWMVFSDNKERDSKGLTTHDRRWFTVRKMVERGIISYASCSTAMVNVNALAEKDGVINIYVKNFTDYEDVENTARMVVQQLNLKNTIRFKTTGATRSGKYVVDGDSDVAIYKFAFGEMYVKGSDRKFAKFSQKEQAKLKNLLQQSINKKDGASSTCNPPAGEALKVDDKVEGACHNDTDSPANSDEESNGNQ